MLANPANLVLSFEPTSFAGSPVIGELYWQQAFNGFRRVVALWNFNGRQTGAVDTRTPPSYQLIYNKKNSPPLRLINGVCLFRRVHKHNLFGRIIQLKGQGAGIQESAGFYCPARLLSCIVAAFNLFPFGVFHQKPALCG